MNSVVEKAKLEEEHFIPTASIAKNADKGLKLRAKFQRGGTEVGVGRAEELKQQKPLPLSTIKRMYSYFCRHSVDKRAEHFGDETNPSAGYIAWLLWGGEAGYEWVKRILGKK
jgi:hypothetical protein